MTTMLTLTAPAAEQAQAPAEAPADLVTCQRICQAGDTCPTYGGEFCPSDPKLVAACNRC